MITLLLADVPSGVDGDDSHRRPLGARQQVANRLVDLLPGTTFDDNGRGVFHRGHYQIAFMLYGDPATSIGVAFDQVDAFAPLARILEKTGWSLLDPEGKGAVDLAASRAAGRAIFAGDPAAGELLASAPAAPGSRRTRLLRAAGIGLAIAASAGAAWKMASSRASGLPATILATQSQVTRFETYPDRVLRRRDFMQKLPAPYATDRIVEQLVDARMASRAYSNFVDGRFTSPELLSDPAVWSRFQMPAFLPESFARHERDGYRFEFRGEGCEETEPGWPECRGFVYLARPLRAPEGGGVTLALFSADDRIRIRTDGAVPTEDDPVLEGR